MSLNAKMNSITAEDLMELQEAASRLRSQCAQKEADNKMLVQTLRDYSEQIFRLRTNELLLKKEVSMWSSYHRLFAKPLYETRLTLGRCQCETQQLLVQEMVRDRERNNSLIRVERRKWERKHTALLEEVRRLKEGKEEKECHGDVGVRMKRALEDCQQTRKKVSTLQNDLAFCMKRLEESERERERVQRHLSGHVAALEKSSRDGLDVKQYEEEIRSRDVTIAQLQRTVREMNTFLAESLSSRLEMGADAQTPLLLGQPPEENSLNTTRRLVKDSCSSEKLNQSIQKLREPLRNEISSSTHRRRLFSQYSSPRSPTTTSFFSSLTEKQYDSKGVDLREFLARELRAPLS